MKKITLPVLLLAAPLLVSSSFGAIVNGDFSSATVGSENHVLFSNLDDGWVGKSDGWDFSSGAAVFVGDASKPGLGQAATFTGSAAFTYELTFDYIAFDGDEFTTPGDLNVIVTAYDAGTSPADDDRFFTGLNFISEQSRIIGTGGTWTDLSDGSNHGGNADADVSTFTGTAGVLTSHTIALNFGSIAIADYEYIGVKFWSGDGTLPGAIIDNVAIVATPVPEPSTYALLGGLCALTAVMVRRRN